MLNSSEIISSFSNSNFAILFLPTNLPTEILVCKTKLPNNMHFVKRNGFFGQISEHVHEGTPNKNFDASVSSSPNGSCCNAILQKSPGAPVPTQTANIINESQSTQEDISILENMFSNGEFHVEAIHNDLVSIILKNF